MTKTSNATLMELEQATPPLREVHSSVSQGFTELTEKVKHLEQIQPPQLVRWGRYEISGLLGEGGQAVVFRAWDTVLKRDVAIKVPRLNTLLDAEHRQRLARESDSLSRLDHPHIVPIHDAGETDGMPYLVFGYCSGGTLAHLLTARKPPVPCRTAVEWVVQIADAVQHAHENGVLHRDIKPNNIFLQHASVAHNDDNQKLQLKLGDFGLAKLMDVTQPDDGQTRLQDRIGTPGHMAPEQELSQHHLLSPATDVYGLGVLLFELLTGKLPFPMKSLHIISEPPSLRRLRSDVSTDLEAVCQKCLSRDPAQRYSSAAELATELRRYLQGERTSIRPATFWQSTVRRITNNKTTSILSACIILLLLSLLLLAKQAPHQLKEPIKVDCNEAWALAFTPDNRHLLVAGDTGTRDNNEAVIEHVTVIDLKTGKKRSFPTLHDAMLKNIAVIDGGNTLITSSYDGSVGEYDWKTGNPRKQHWSIRSLDKDRNITLNKNEIGSMGISADGEWIGVGTNVNTSGYSSVHVKNRKSDTIHSLQQSTNCNVIQILFPPTFQPGQLLFTCSPIDHIFYWDISQATFSIKWDFKHAIQNIAFSPDGDTIATALSNNNIAISRWPDMKQQTELKRHTCEIRKIAFSPDGRWLASTDIEGTIIWWDLASGTWRAAFSSGVRINAVQFSPDGEWLAIGQHDGNVSIFSTTNIQR